MKANTNLSIEPTCWLEAHILGLGTAPVVAAFSHYERIAGYE